MSETAHYLCAAHNPQILEDCVMVQKDSTAAQALISQAGLDNVHASYPAEVNQALGQALRHNLDVKALELVLHMPGARVDVTR